MPVTHRNRKGDLYYLHEGLTPKGKAKYFFSRKNAGQLVERIPEGFEVYEKPDSAQVYLRKATLSAVTQGEREYAQAECRRLAETEAVLVSVEGDSLVVYFADSSEWERAREILRSLGMSSWRSHDTRDWQATIGTYMKMLRFTLLDEEQRLYGVDRWCFRGSVDDWIPLKSPVPLERALRDYAPHLGRESFYDLL